MDLKTTLSTFLTFAAAVAVGCGAAVVIASTAAVSRAAPNLRAPMQAPVEIVRLEPVVVTISKHTYEAVRNEGRTAPEVARVGDAAKVKRG